MWEEFNQLGIMGIGWDGLGYNLKDFPTKQDIKEYLKNIYDMLKILIKMMHIVYGSLQMKLKLAILFLQKKEYIKLLVKVL